MKEYSINFTAAEVRAILDGRKTQFRRILKPQPDCHSYDGPPKLDSFGTFSYPAGACGRWTCPYGQPGDRLWVRETWARNSGTAGGCLYKCDYGNAKSFHTRCLKTGKLIHEVNRWQSPVTMPRKASRIWLEIQSVRVERLQDISEQDAKAEGVDPTDFTGYEHPDYPTLSAGAYRNGFIERCGDDFWSANPWVWVVDFRVVEGGHE